MTSPEEDPLNGQQNPEELYEQQNIEQPTHSTSEIIRNKIQGGGDKKSFYDKTFGRFRQGRDNVADQSKVKKHPLANRLFNRAPHNRVENIKNQVDEGRRKLATAGDMSKKTARLATGIAKKGAEKTIQLAAGAVSGGLGWLVAIGQTLLNTLIKYRKYIPYVVLILVLLLATSTSLLGIGALQSGPGIFPIGVAGEQQKNNVLKWAGDDNAKLEDLQNGAKVMIDDLKKMKDIAAKKYVGNAEKIKNCNASIDEIIALLNTIPNLTDLPTRKQRAQETQAKLDAFASAYPELGPAAGTCLDIDKLIANGSIKFLHNDDPDAGLIKYGKSELPNGEIGNISKNICSTLVFLTSKGYTVLISTISYHHTMNGKLHPQRMAFDIGRINNVSLRKEGPGLQMSTEVQNLLIQNKDALKINEMFGPDSGKNMYIDRGNVYTESNQSNIDLHKDHIHLGFY